MNSLEITEFKMNVIRHLLADEQVVELLDPNHEFEYPAVSLIRNKRSRRTSQ